MINWEVPWKWNSAVFGGRLSKCVGPSLGWGLCTCLLAPQSAQSHARQMCQGPVGLGPCSLLSPGLSALARAPLLGSPFSFDCVVSPQTLLSKNNGPSREIAHRALSCIIIPPPGSQSAS
jgi:hypothetical protein